MRNYVIKGNICYSISGSEISITENGYAVCEENRCSGVYQELPEMYEKLPLYDYSGKIVIPGLTDLHVHAPQYAFRGLAMDLQLIDWLNTYTFAEEAKYQNLEYAEKAYEIFVQDLKESATARACIFGTIHTDATLLLMDKLEKSGIKAYVGKVNMDRNCPEYLCEESAEKAAGETERWLMSAAKYEHVKPILTPRFTPCCSDELFEKLSAL